MLCCYDSRKASVSAPHGVSETGVFQSKEIRWIARNYS